jgi:hypothetical protein
MTLAKQAVRLIPTRVPPKVRPLLLAELDRELPAMAAVLVLAERFAKEAAGFFTAKGWRPAAPPLTDQEWLALHRLFASGQLKVFHSLPEATRRLLEIARIDIRGPDEEAQERLCKRRAARAYWEDVRVRAAAIRTETYARMGWAEPKEDA